MRALLSALLASVLLCAFGSAAVADPAPPPCSRGCEVKPGTYEGTNDQGHPVLVHVSAVHLKSGSVIAATIHVVDRFETMFPIDCGGDRRLFHYEPEDRWFDIDHLNVHVTDQQTEKKLERATDRHFSISWKPDGDATGLAKYHLYSEHSPGLKGECHGETTFTLHRAGE